MREEESLLPEREYTVKTFKEFGTEIGEMVDQKNAAYGDSFAKTGEFLKLLYPDGVKPDQYGDMLALVRIFDKCKRIATDKDAFGESPFDDIAGYGLLGGMMARAKLRQIPDDTGAL